jgi:hypothetical protein
MSQPVYKGRCHCGGVQFEVQGGFGVVVCHCQDCQKLHGNAFAMIVIAPEQLVMQAEQSLTRYRSSDKVQRSFCNQCGSRLFKEPDDGQKLMVSMGLLGPETGLQIRKNVWVESKPDWYPLFEAVPE